MDCNPIKKILILPQNPLVPYYSLRSSIKEGHYVFSEEHLSGEHYLTYVQSQWYKSPSDAKDELFNCVKTVGANCLVNLTLHKRTFSEGNYNYTMHSWSGLTGIYFDNYEFDTEAEMNEANEQLRPHAAMVKERLVLVEKELAKQRARQESGNFLGAIIITAVVLLVLYFMFSG